jgi:S-adenosylmethionine hydrolase
LAHNLFLVARAVRPIITLTSDFGLRDYYVAAMNAVLLRYCPDARLIDVTHQVPRHDILCGSITLERAIDGFPPDTVHLAVVDPGVGTDRKIAMFRLRDQMIVCPDNGLITWGWRLHGPGEAFEVTWRPKESSTTFHGRDIMAPVAGMLASGRRLPDGPAPLPEPVLLDIAPTAPDDRRGRIIHIDVFGNATTNIPHEVIRGTIVKDVKVRGRKLGRLKRTYWDVAPGKILPLIGSSGLLEIAVRDGSAAKVLKLNVGDEVVLS